MHDHMAQKYLWSNFWWQNRCHDIPQRKGTWISGNVIGLYHCWPGQSRHVWLHQVNGWWFYKYQSYYQDSTQPSSLTFIQSQWRGTDPGLKRAQTLHTYVAKALFATKRDLPDIYTAVAFLITRVMTPDGHDWKKLLRMINYLRGTLELPLALQASKTNIVK